MKLWNKQNWKEEKAAVEETETASSGKKEGRLDKVILWKEGVQEEKPAVLGVTEQPMRKELLVGWWVGLTGLRKRNYVKVRVCVCMSLEGIDDGAGVESRFHQGKE